MRGLKSIFISYNIKLYRKDTAWEESGILKEKQKKQISL